LERDESSRPYQVAYFYRVKWGFQQEFERLYMKNHYPILARQREQGRIRDVAIYRPTFHGDGRSDWTFLTVITFASFDVLGSPSDEEAIARELFPDLETFHKEERRRFELLDAHWDVPLTPIEPGGR
jgi:hypothetical protein